VLIPIILVPGDLFAHTARFVTAAGAGAKNGTDWDNAWAPTDIAYSAMEAADFTVYWSGGASGVTYTVSTMKLRHNTKTYNLEFRPGSASASPSGHDGKVTVKRSAAQLVWMGDASNVPCHNFTWSGETTEGSGTINMVLDLSGVDSTGIAVNANNDIVKFTYLELTGLSANKFFDASDVAQGGWEWSYNYFHDNAGQAEIVITPQTPAYGRYSVHHNTFARGTINYIQGVGSMDVYNNVMDLTDLTSFYDCIHAYSTTSIGFWRIYNNYFKGMLDNGTRKMDQILFFEQAGNAQAIEHIRIYNNIFSGAYGWAIMFENTDYANGTYHDIVVANNAFYNNHIGVAFVGHTATGSTYSDVKVINNIFQHNDSQVSVSGKVARDGDANAIFDGNIIYDTSSAQWFNSDTTVATYTEYGVGSQWRTDHSTYTNNYITNPSFTSTIDYTLQAGSPGINTGIDATAYADMGTGWGYDKNGIARPEGAWDIGAYEFVGDSPDVTAPTLTSATIGVFGSEITLLFSEAVVRNAETGWTITMSSGAVAMTYASGSGSNTLVYTLNRAVWAGETGTVAWTTAANAIEDVSTAGNDLATIATAAVTNNSEAVSSGSTVSVKIGSGAAPKVGVGAAFRIGQMSPTTEYFGYQDNKSAPAGVSWGTAINTAIYWNKVHYVPGGGSKTLLELCAYVKTGTGADGNMRVAIFTNASPAVFVAQGSAQVVVDAAEGWVCHTSFTNVAGDAITPTLTGGTAYKLAYTQDSTDVNVAYVACTAEDMNASPTELTSGYNPTYSYAIVNGNCKAIIAGVQ
jgi:hypothetical protein